MGLGTVGRQFGVLVLAVGLVACGGGGFGTSGTSGGGSSSGGSSSGGSSSGGSSSGGTGSGGTTVSTVLLNASSPQLSSGASTAAQGVTLTATVKDNNNNVVSGVVVTFTASRDSASSCGTGGAVQVVSGTTDNSGVATAMLYTGGDPTNQVIDVNATAAGVSPAAPLQINETGTHITISGPSAVGLNGTASYLIKLADASNNPISGQTLSVSSSVGNGISTPTLVTDNNGQVNVSYTAGTGGLDTLKVQAASLCLSQSQPIQVATQNLSIVAPNANSQIPFATTGTFSVGASIAAAGSGYVVGNILTVQGGTSTTAAQLTVSQINGSGGITAVTVTNAGTYTGLPPSTATVSGGSGSSATFNIAQNVTVQVTGGTFAGQTISFNTTRGTLSAASAMTIAEGVATGVATVMLYQPSAAGNAGGGVLTATCSTCSPSISASTTVQFNATTPATVALQASPSTVAINGASVITASVRDANNNPVANQVVQFTLVDDSGGSLLQSTATTDSSGQAIVNYQAGGTTGSANGVMATGTVASISDSVNLTVGGQALRIVLGTGNTITALNSTEYQEPYSVLVTDSAGNPSPDGSVVNLTTNAVSYQKGYELYNGTLWVPYPEVSCSGGDPGCSAKTSFGCFNEDANLNGILDLGEDYNHDGVLEPGNVASVPATVTLTNGVGQFNITYPKDRANWVQIFLTATITVVNGDQGTTTVIFVLPGLNSDFTSGTVPPPGEFSPYGYLPDPMSGPPLVPPPPGYDTCAKAPPN